MDNAWYRAKVEGLPYPRSHSIFDLKFTPFVWKGRAGAELRLCFVDFGNHTMLPLSSLRPLPEDLQGIPAQAKPAILAGLSSAFCLFSLFLLPLSLGLVRSVDQKYC